MLEYFDDNCISEMGKDIANEIYDMIDEKYILTEK